MTIEELPRNKDFDPCSKCGGYAVRRLSDAQVAYYRAAHRLHHLIQISASSSGPGTADVESYLSRLDKLGSLETERCGSPAQGRLASGGRSPTVYATSCGPVPAGEAGIVAAPAPRCAVVAG
ncbi:hypothetical protein [Streptomyces syringium]|uniref:hypothetical protein n=1 Tax=Streptomyces syringium TaxID=76729 RepID=UPI0034519742